MGDEALHFELSPVDARGSRLALDTALAPPDNASQPDQEPPAEEARA